MDIFRTIAERRIEEAIKRGELDDLPLRGRPLGPDLAGVPDEDRVAYRLLKNANVLPEELHLKRQIRELRGQLDGARLAPGRRKELLRELNAAESHYNFLTERRLRRL